MTVPADFAFGDVVKPDIEVVLSYWVKMHVSRGNYGFPEFRREFQHANLVTRRDIQLAVEVKMSNRALRQQHDLKRFSGRYRVPTPSEKALGKTLEPEINAPSGAIEQIAIMKGKRDDVRSVDGAQPLLQFAAKGRLVGTVMV